MRKIILMVLAVSLIGFYGCNKDKKETEKTKKERIIVKKTDLQVKTDIDSLLNELDATWNEMIASDDHKIESLQTLLAKVGSDKNYDKQAFKAVVSAKDSLKLKRYDRQTLSSVGKVDAYDAATDSLLRSTNQLADASGIYQKDTTAAKLWDQIQQEDYRIPFHRSNYDELVKEYNQYLTDYKPQLNKLGKPYNSLQELAPFVKSN